MRWHPVFKEMRLDAVLYATKAEFLPFLSNCNSGFCFTLRRVAEISCGQNAASRALSSSMSETKYWSAAEVLAGVIEKPAAERMGYPRFLVIVDGERHEIKTVRSLDKLVSVISSKAPKVFVNAGKGITIDFD